MKLGLVSAIFDDMQYEEVIDQASLVGFSTVEIMCWPKGKAERRYAGISHVDVDMLNNKIIEHMKTYASDRNINISSFGYYPNPLDPDLEKRNYCIKHLKKVILAARDFGIEVVNTFAGRDKLKNIEDNFILFREIWIPIIEYAEKHNIKIAIENCPMLFTNDEWPGGNNIAASPAIWREMFSEIPSEHFGLNLDPSHLLWQGINYIKPIYEFKDRIFHVHLKDSKILKDKIEDVGILATPLQYHAPKIPGLGDINWGSFISALTDIGYEGAACVEFEDRSFEKSLEKKKVALEQTYNYFKQYIS